jgi:hypothetical protein
MFAVDFAFRSIRPKHRSGLGRAVHRLNHLRDFPMNARVTRIQIDALRRAAETQWHVPAIMFRRLAGMSALSPFAASLQWNRWALEKGAVGNSVALQAMHTVSALWSSWLRSAMSGATPAKQLHDALANAAIASATVMDPMHRRVKHNAKRKR